MMSDHEQDPNAPGDSSRPRLIGSSRAGMILAFGFFLLGALNFYLIPSTGGIIGGYWNPLLYDLVLNEFFLVLVYIPLIQLPLATGFSLGSRDRSTHGGLSLNPLAVYGLFGMVAATRVALLVAGSVYPWDAGELQLLVDLVLFERLGGVVSVPVVVNTVFLFYFPLVVAVQLLIHRTPLVGDGRSDTGSPLLPSPSPDQRPGTEPSPGSGTGFRTGVAAFEESWFLPRIPYWSVIVGVVLLLIAGLATGGLELAFSIAGFLLSLYQTQPPRDRG